MPRSRGRNRRPQKDPAAERADERNHHYDRWVIGVGGTLLTAACDFGFFWSESHLLALLIFAAWLSLLSIYLIGITRTGREWSAVAIAGWFGLAGITNAVVPPPPDVETGGTLQPGNDRTPSNGCDGTPIDADAVKVLVGNNATALNGLGRMTALKVGNCPVFGVERTLQGVSPVVDLFDSDGKHIAAISGGSFHAFSGGAHLVDRRGDLGTLTISDTAGKELLFVKFLNPTTIQIRGIFGCPGHAPVIVKENQPIVGFMFSNSCFAGRDGSIGLTIN